MGKRLGDAGVAVTILPATDLFLMGASAITMCGAGSWTQPFRRARLPLLALAQQHFSTHSPFRGRLAAAYGEPHANTCKSPAERIAECFEMLTSRSAKL